MPPAASGETVEISANVRRAALLFMGGLAFIIVVGLVEEWRPNVIMKDKSGPLDMSPLIQTTMLGISALIVACCGVQAAGIPESSLFGSGLVAVVALFGVAWMANTFIAANESTIVGQLGDIARSTPLLISVALFVVAAITTSQSSTTFSIIPIGIALGIPPQILAAMWPSIIGVSLLPTNGSQISSVEIDQTGKTQIGQFVINHSFIIPVAVYTIVSVGTGTVIAGLR